MPAKKTAKKTAKKSAKKIAKKSIAETSATKEYDALPGKGYNLIKHAPRVTTTSELISKRIERRKGREVRMLSFSESRVYTYPSMSFMMDWLLNSRGMPQTIYNVIGKDGSGKTTLFLTLIGHLARSGVFSQYFACEKKDIHPEWAQRCFGPDRATAEGLSGVIPFFKDMKTLPDFFEKMIESLKEYRDEKSKAHIPLHVPISLFADPLNKLPTEAQMDGITAYGGGNRAKQVDLADRGHMWDRAKWYHDLMQRMTGILPEFNARLFIGEHQNQQGVAGQGGGGNAFTPEWMKEGSNRTRPGGESINQTAGIQLTLVDRGFIYSAGEKVARRISVTPLKSSHGPSKSIRVGQFALKQDDFEDTKETLEPPIRWDYPTLEWCAANGYFGASVSGKTLAQYRYNIEELNIRGLSLTEAAEALMAPENQHMFDRLGHQLKIPGYFSVEKAMEETPAPTPPPPAPAPPTPPEGV